MAGNVMAANSEVLDVRELFLEELSPEELDAVSGGWSITVQLGPFGVATGSKIGGAIAEAVQATVAKAGQ